MLGVVSTRLAVLLFVVAAAQATRDVDRLKSSSCEGKVDTSRVCVDTVLAARDAVVEEVSSGGIFKSLWGMNPQEDFYQYRRGKRRVGSGAHANVYIVRNDKTGKEEIIKVLKSDLMGKSIRPSSIQVLSKECEIMKILQEQKRRQKDPIGASRLATCIEDHARKKDESLIVLENEGDDVYHFFQMHTAAHWNDREQRLTTVKSIMRQALQGLAYLADEGIWHRDLKPDNIAVRMDSDKLTVKILDFGFAEKWSSMGELKDGKFGGFAYAPPEVRFYSDIRAEADEELRAKEQKLRKKEKRGCDSKQLKKERKEMNDKFLSTEKDARDTMNNQLLSSVSSWDVWSLGVTMLELLCGVDYTPESRSFNDWRMENNKIVGQMILTLFENYHLHKAEILQLANCSVDDESKKLLGEMLKVDAHKRSTPRLLLELFSSPE